MKSTGIKVRTGQFSLHTLMLVTALVALVIATTPVVVALPFELLAITVFIAVVTALLVAEFATFSIGCRLATITFLGLFTFAFGFQALLSGPAAIQPFWVALVFCVIVCLVSQIVTRPRVVRVSSILTSTALATILIVQFLSTADDRHFLKRFRHFDNDGGVSYQLVDNVAGPERLQFIQSSWPRVLAYSLMNYTDEYVWPDITKCTSLLCSAKRIQELSFVGQLSKEDRGALSRQFQLEHLSFSGADLTDEDVYAFSNLNIRSLSFFDCLLPADFFSKLPVNKELWVLQIHDGRSGDLNGLSAQSELHQICLSGFSLTPSDYRELARLPKLLELDLSGAPVQNDSMSIFATELMSTRAAIRGRFRLKLQLGSTRITGLEELLSTQLVHELILVDSPLNSVEFVSLQRRFPFVRIIDVESGVRYNGIKP